LCLGIAAGLAYGLKIALVIGAAFELRHDVIDDACRPELTLTLAGLAQSFVSTQDDLALLIPVSSIASIMAATTMTISKLADLAVFLVRCTEACSVAD
jgi:hypothetical protein